MHLRLLIVLTGVFIFTAPLTFAQTNIPSLTALMSETFEGAKPDSWDNQWRVSANSTLSIVDGNGGQVLQVPLRAAENRLRYPDAGTPTEGYLSFSFNPSSVTLPGLTGITGNANIRQRSILIAEIRGPNDANAEQSVLALHMVSTTNNDYQLFMRWNNESGSSSFDTTDDTLNMMPLANSWQEITMGYQQGSWISLWIDGQLQRTITATHEANFGSVIEIGHTETNNSSALAGVSGNMLFDNVVFSERNQQIDQLWVDASMGSDSNSGLAEDQPLATIGQAALLAVPGTTVHIKPGTYRETIAPARSGTATQTITYQAENGLGTVDLRGSIAGSSLTWVQMTTDEIGLPSGVSPNNIYYADLSAFGLTETPRFVAQVNSGTGAVSQRLPLAREPDWSVTTDWKYAEFWWTADGGSTVASCNPPMDSDSNTCDAAQRSKTQLTDRNLFAEPTVVEAGNLTTVGDLTGGNLFALDTNTGHYLYSRDIVAHNTVAGTITVDEEAIFPGQDSSLNLDSGLGWGTKYFVENRPQLLDNAGEWWYDTTAQRLYLWPLSAGSPVNQNIEISRYDHGFDLSNRSHINLTGLDIALYNQAAVYQLNETDEGAHQNVVENCQLSYAQRGVRLLQKTGQNATYTTNGFTVDNCEIGHMDASAIATDYTWGANNGNTPSLFTIAGITNLTITNSKLHDLSFRNDVRSDTPNGSVINYPDNVHFEGNHVYNVAHNGIMFARSINQPNVAGQKFNLSDSEIKIGNILIKDNIFEDACQMGPDCGGVKIWGAGRDDNTHIFRDVLIVGNVFQDNTGWSYISEQRGKWSAGTVQGKGGFGFYADLATGLHAFRNVAHNNSYSGYYFNGVWQDDSLIFANNVSANTLYAFRLDATEFDVEELGGSVDTQIINNVMMNNEGYGIFLNKVNDAYGNFNVNNNLYYNNTSNANPDGFDDFWRIFLRDVGANGTLIEYSTLSDIQNNSQWEASGQSGAPSFSNDGSSFTCSATPCADFALTENSALAINRGQAIPTSLQTLLTEYGLTSSVTDGQPDIGAYESSVTLNDYSAYLPVLIKD